MQYTIRGVPPVVDDALRMRARETGRSLNEVVIDALAAEEGDVKAALRRWEPGRLQVGRDLIARARWIGEAYQSRFDATPGDPRLRYGLYGPGA